MTPEELKATLKRLKLSQIALADLCDQSPVTVNRWMSGVRGVPTWLPSWLAMYGMLTAEERMIVWPD